MRLRLFLTAWIVFSLHYATDFVREHFLVVSMVEDGTFDLGPYYGLHEDIFVNPPNAPVQGVHHGANPGISMLAAIPYALTRPLVDRVVARQLALRDARATTPVRCTTTRDRHACASIAKQSAAASMSASVLSVS